MSVESQSEPKSRAFRRKTKECIANTFSMDFVRRILPIISWLPKYKPEYFLHDIFAGITVGLAAIPQGIAYAVIAGLPAEYGLYASLTSGVIYMVFGTCYNVTVGPTAILAVMVARQVTNYSADFAILIAFLSGICVFIMALFRLNFQVDFISMPVINGFKMAAALQIAAGQLKYFFGLEGSSGDSLVQSIQNLYTNITTVQLWETVLSSGTILMLILLQKIGQCCTRNDGFVKQKRWFIFTLSNAAVVAIGMVIAYIVKVSTDSEHLAVIGDIGSGLPKFSWPPFSTLVGDEVYGFRDMFSIIGMQSIVLLFMTIFETVAVAKAFTANVKIDTTQELIAVSICNVIGSFGQSMPITSSFTGTALNDASGVKSPIGGATKVLLIAVSLTCLTSSLYYIPKASLAGVIITEMFIMIDYGLFAKLWRNSRREFFILVGTVVGCLTTGLQYGLLMGMVQEALLILVYAARPKIEVNKIECDKGDVTVVSLSDKLLYCAVEHVRQKVITASSNEIPVVVDGSNITKFDFTAAFNLMAIVRDLDTTHQIVLFNFTDELKKICLDIESRYANKFVSAESYNEIIDALPKDV
ncbi:sodium-independent sulfate anion transporter-like [Trichoplusia ni]|uniref:Sodium-independent sulfate anion transporter-like n=1 Tax=Trichoplusia ni TaxID=7111 RepID=A0A7E5WQG2_TRINI|nr:sodium-independent sulfate anion transporter-like [Trichoplusia ni]